MKLMLLTALGLASSSALADDDVKVASTTTAVVPEVAKSTEDVVIEEKTMNRLLALTVKLPKGAKHVAEAKRVRAIKSAWLAVEKEGAVAWPATDKLERQYRTTALLVVYSFFESAWNADAQGDCTEIGSDGAVRKGPCKSFGIMQVNGRFISVASIDRVLKDPVLGYRAGLAIIHDTIKKCPGKDGKLSIKMAMGRYETGLYCGGAMHDVEYRLSFLDFTP
jgi:hypothetical protein